MEHIQELHAEQFIEQCWEKWFESRDEDAANILISKYMNLVTFHVNRISQKLPKNVCTNDLISYGMIGLYTAMEKFDPSRDLKFETYASFRIKGAMLDSLRKEDLLPRGARDKIKQIERTIERLEHEKLRNVTTDEVANELNIETEKVTAALNKGFFANIVSMDKHIQLYKDQGIKKPLLTDAPAPSPEDELVRAELYSELEQVIQTLTDKEQLVLQLVYKEELTLTEISGILGVSISRVSQIHSICINKLKKLLTKVI